MKKNRLFLITIILIKIFYSTIVFSQIENNKDANLFIKTKPLNVRVEIFKDGKLIKRNITDDEGNFKDTLSAGNYQIIISKGFEYKFFKKEIEIKDKPVNIEANLEKFYDMGKLGWYSGDAHIHSIFSDGGQKFSLVVRAAKAEGLNWMISTEHNQGALKLWKHLQKNNYNKDDFCVIFGEEVSTLNLGHFNALGCKEYVSEAVKTAKQIFENTHKFEGLIVINHPFMGDPLFGSFSSYLWQVNSGDAEFFDNFDGIEVWSGTWGWDEEETLRYWFKLLNEKKKYFAIANTDSHCVFDNPLGNPRTYIYLGDKKLTRENILTALKNCNAFLTSGPLLEFTINEKIPGETVNASWVRN